MKLKMIIGGGRGAGRGGGRGGVWGEANQPSEPQLKSLMGFYTAGSRRPRAGF